MPLKKGVKNRGPNINMLKSEGYPPAQAKAIALKTAGVPKAKPKRKKKAK
jgi:hypothetical protein